MKISELLAKDQITLSFEVFPPKKAERFEAVKTAAEDIADLHPSFMSITYGAGGSTAGFTAELAADLKKDTGVPVMPHLTAGSAATVTPGKPSAFIFFTKAWRSSVSSSRAAVSISPAAPIAHSR